MKCELSCSLDVEEPDLSDVPIASSCLLGFLRDHGVSDPAFLAAFEQASVEALNNAVEHGCASAPQKFFRARLHVRQDGVELRVSDPSGFRGWDGPPELPEDPFAEGGRGHFLMAHMTDELLHEREDGCHVLVLRKRFASEPWVYVPGQADQVLSEMTDELVASYEMISTLLGLGEWLATAPDLNAFAEGALARLCEVTGADLAYVRFEEGGTLVNIQQWGQCLAEPPRAIPIAPGGVENDVFLTGNEITLPEGFSLAAGDPLAGVFHSGFVTPVLFKDSRRGILLIGQTRTRSFFDAGKLKIARMVAEYLGIVLMMSELQKRRSREDRALRDLEIASQIQMSLMPREFSAFQGLDISGTCRPAMQAGGDYFDVLALPDGSVLCVVADVMGKGLPAALLATMLRTNLRAVVATGVTDPGDILRTINNLMCPDLINLEMFITMACVWISPSRDVLRHACAGHLLPLLQRAAKPAEIEEVLGGGMPIGIFPDSHFLPEVSELLPGDRVLLYTDGIVEACSPSDEFFDGVRVKESLGQSVARGSLASLDALLSEVEVFTQGAPPSDDRTALLISRTL